MGYAPILIGTHTRVEHLKRAVESLLKNKISKESEVYFSVDGPRNFAEGKLIQEVKAYIESVQGFKKVNKIYRDVNVGHFDNFEFAVSEIYKNHETIIQMEDDIVVSPFFLEYMNDGLIKYKSNQKIISISGNIWPYLKLNFSEDTALLPLFNGWGWGTWRDKDRQINHTDICSEYYRSKLKLFYTHIRNPSLLPIIYRSYKRGFRAGDVNRQLYIYKHDALVLFPRESLTRNMGWDGSGQNCNINGIYSAVELSQNKINVFSQPYAFKWHDGLKIFITFGGFRLFIVELKTYIRNVIIDGFNK